eukprot:scaffold93715_cov78-Attheya_sp.AAC.2
MDVIRLRSSGGYILSCFLSHSSLTFKGDQSFERISSSGLHADWNNNPGTSCLKASSPEVLVISCRPPDQTTLGVLDKKGFLFW